MEAAVAPSGLFLIFGLPSWGLRPGSYTHLCRRAAQCWPLRTVISAPETGGCHGAIEILAAVPESSRLPIAISSRRDGLDPYHRPSPTGTSGRLRCGEEDPKVSRFARKGLALLRRDGCKRLGASPGFRAPHTHPALEGRQIPPRSDPEGTGKICRPFGAGGGEGRPFLGLRPRLFNLHPYRVSPGRTLRGADLCGIQPK
jgi:hypothetical protein